MIHKAPVGDGKKKQVNYQCGAQSESVKLPELLNLTTQVKR